MFFWPYVYVKYGTSCNSQLGARSVLLPSPQLVPVFLLKVLRKAQFSILLASQVPVRFESFVCLSIVIIRINLHPIIRKH